jgi:hypothetical protein
MHPASPPPCTYRLQSSRLLHERLLLCHHLVREASLLSVQRLQGALPLAQQLDLSCVSGVRGILATANSQQHGVQHKRQDNSRVLWREPCIMQAATPSIRGGS